MAIDNIVWAVNGPDTDPQLAREQTWNNTGGQTGIVGPESLEVRAQPTPGASVRVMPGGFTAAATPGGSVGYTTAPRQSYGRSISQTHTVPIRATGSSGSRTDVVGIIINDPQYEGTADSMTPEEMAEHPFWSYHVIENASSSANRATQFGLSRPFVPLARVTIPANTATITNSMITDLRFLAVENSKLDHVVQRPAQSHTLTTSNASDWTSLDQISSVIIPQWATHVTLGGSIKGAAATGSGNVNGETRLALSPGTGNKYTGAIPFNESDAWSRFELPAGGTIALDENDRGRRAFIRFQVRRSTGTGGLSISEALALYDLTLSFSENPTNA